MTADMRQPQGHPLPVAAATRSAARALVHAAHALTFIVLMATGVLIFVPELRELATGGYSLLIRQIHRWTGVAFIVVPLAAMASAGTEVVFLRGAEGTPRNRLKAVHVAASVIMTALFTGTGLVLWATSSFGESVVDASYLLHDWLTYAAAALLAAHLLEVAVGAVVEGVRPIG